jgi:hypothetical protein
MISYNGLSIGVAAGVKQRLRTFCCQHVLGAQHGDQRVLMSFRCILIGSRHTIQFERDMRHDTFLGVSIEQ